MTSASVPASITRWAMASVSSRASGVPTGTSARSRMPATAPAGTPSTRTVRAASTGLSSTSQRPATRTATTARPQAASSHGRRRTAAARAANREREEASPLGDRFAPALGGRRRARGCCGAGSVGSVGWAGSSAGPGRRGGGRRRGRRGRRGQRPRAAASTAPPLPASASRRRISRTHHRHVTGTDRDHQVTGSHEGRARSARPGTTTATSALHPVVDPRRRPARR